MAMLVVASVAMVDDKRSSRRVRPMARIAFAAGVAASIAANIAAAQPTWGARVVAAWPALALLLVVEMLSRSGRAHPAKTPVARTGGGTDAGARAGRDPGSATLQPWSDPQFPADVPAPNNGSPQLGSRRPAALTRQLAADILDAEPGITRKEIAARLGLSTRRLREVPANAP
jgi:hypothetical protein